MTKFFVRAVVLATALFLTTGAWASCGVPAHLGKWTNLDRSASPYALDITLVSCVNADYRLVAITRQSNNTLYRRDPVKATEPQPGRMTANVYTGGYMDRMTLSLVTQNGRRLLKADIFHQSLDSKPSARDIYYFEPGLVPPPAPKVVSLGKRVSSSSSAAPAQAPTYGQSGVVMLVNGKTEKCLTIAGGRNPDNNIPTVQYDCDDDPSRRWVLTEADPGTYQIRNVQTGKCLTIAGGRSDANSLTALQYECDADPSRRWAMSQAEEGLVQLRNVQTGKCLTIAGGTSPDNNIEGVQYDCDDDRSRRWSIRQR